MRAFLRAFGQNFISPPPLSAYPPPHPPAASSSEPVRGAGERGRPLRGGDGPEADPGAAGLRGQVTGGGGKNEGEKKQRKNAGARGASEG